MRTYYLRNHYLEIYMKKSCVRFIVTCAVGMFCVNAMLAQGDPPMDPNALPETYCMTYGKADPITGGVSNLNDNCDIEVCVTFTTCTEDPLTGECNPAIPEETHVECHTFSPGDTYCFSGPSGLSNEVLVGTPQFTYQAAQNPTYGWIDIDEINTVGGFIHDSSIPGAVYNGCWGAFPPGGTSYELVTTGGNFWHEIWTLE